MQMLHCVICGKPTEAHDYADAVICDTCPVPVVEESSEPDKNVAKASPTNS